MSIREQARSFFLGAVFCFQCAKVRILCNSAKFLYRYVLVTCAVYK